MTKNPASMPKGCIFIYIQGSSDPFPASEQKETALRYAGQGLIF
jgi:hypothetical protein